MRKLICLALLILCVPALAETRDEKSVALAHATMEAMGGEQAWNATRYVQWDFFGGRTHYWDRHTGDIRIEAEFEGDRYLFLMNIQSKQGRVLKNDEPLPAGDELDKALQQGYELWVNDSYWMFMPYKLLDPGVSLEYLGERAMDDGRQADVVTMTFGDGIGVTPQNRYDVFIAKDTGLVESWAFYADAGDEEPRFTMPWTGWQKFGDIMLATSRGRDRDWAIAVHETLPASVFDDTAPVD